MTEAARGGREFECNICLDPVTEPVVSLCGHLFCWPCLHRWLVARPEAPSCPVCKGAISVDSLVPVYGRADRVEGGTVVPPRPSGHQLRERSGHRQLLLGGLRITVGIDPGLAGADGSFRLSLNDLMLELQECLEQLELSDLLGPLVSRVFLWIAVLFGVWLLIA